MLIPVQTQGARACQLRAQGGNPHCTRCLSTTVCTHTKSHSFTLAHCRHTYNQTYTGLGCGRKLEYPEKIHVDMERTCKCHTENGPSLKSSFFPHQCYKEMMLNESVWFQDLGYIQGNAPQTHRQQKQWCRSLVLTWKDNDVIGFYISSFYTLHYNLQTSCLSV